jgi:hypothetical protein
MKVGIFMDENMVEQLLKDSWMKKTNRWQMIVDRIKFQWKMHGWLKNMHERWMDVWWKNDEWKNLDKWINAWWMNEFAFKVDNSMVNKTWTKKVFQIINKGT